MEQHQPKNVVEEKSDWWFRFAGDFSDRTAKVHFNAPSRLQGEQLHFQRVMLATL